MGLHDPTPLWLSTYLPMAIAAVLLLLALCLLIIDHWRNR